MKVKHYICPRKCGKTTFAKDLQMESPEDTLLFTMSGGVWKWGFSIRGERYKRIIIDEYIERYNKLSNDIEKEKFIDWIREELMSTLIPNGELILISTPDKRYDAFMFQMLNMGFGGIVEGHESLTKENIERVNRDVKEMKNKFLNSSVVNIIKADFKRSKMDEWKIKMNGRLPEEVYQAEILGEFLK